ncbi:NAD-dependent epimerase/dehydratase family protein [Labrys wisconsinensis]|uniref:Nucleoside-diphosphate-sugar epimerase n=1 Tax=Labrys wisconsinensis TaxID=425677 RepID=A0ABU0JLU4_9HYPH|nr:NAD(P)-dependent oxidoreductase [Labrys wisconsinensis]MDQ0475238.1 nucleoside-diphosphate-sugar epimerase [Labrys wisconsinensis]
MAQGAESRDARLGSSRVLVTGGAGYMGSMLVRRLLALGHEVAVLDSFLYGHQSLSGLSSEVTIFHGDVRGASVTQRALDGVDAVVHLGEIVGEPACAFSPALARSVNLDGARRLIDEAVKRGVRHFVYASSCSVYGFDSGDSLLTESSACNPVGIYGQLKLEVERYVKSAHSRDLRSTILRFATLHGPSHRPRLDIVANVMTARAFSTGAITVSGPGSWRPHLSVGDAARAVAIVLQRSVTDAGVDIFNVGDAEQNFTMEGLAHIVQEVVPGTRCTIEDGGKTENQLSYRVDFRKIYSELGFVPLDTIRRQLKLLLAFLEGEGRVDDPRFSNLRSAELRA